MDHFPGKGCINNINFRSLLCNTQNETEMSINLFDKLESNTILELHSILFFFVIGNYNFQAFLMQFRIALSFFLMREGSWWIRKQSIQQHII